MINPLSHTGFFFLQHTLNGWEWASSFVMEWFDWELGQEFMNWVKPCPGSSTYTQVNVFDVPITNVVWFPYTQNSFIFIDALHGTKVINFHKKFWIIFAIMRPWNPELRENFQERLLNSCSMFRILFSVCSTYAIHMLHIRRKSMIICCIETTCCMFGMIHKFNLMIYIINWPQYRHNSNPASRK